MSLHVSIIFGFCTYFQVKTAPAVPENNNLRRHFICSPKFAGLIASPGTPETALTFQPCTYRALVKHRH